MIVQIGGGLGNQMFQYTFAKTLAHRGFDVALDVSWYDLDSNKTPNGGGAIKEPESKNQNNIIIRDFEIGNFMISLPLSKKSNTKKFFYSNDFTFIFRRIIKNFLPRKYRIPIIDLTLEKQRHCYKR